MERWEEEIALLIRDVPSVAYRRYDRNVADLSAENYNRRLRGTSTRRSKRCFKFVCRASRLWQSSLEFHALDSTSTGIQYRDDASVDVDAGPLCCS
jgi:hypothetical protein